MIIVYWAPKPYSNYEGPYSRFGAGVFGFRVDCVQGLRSRVQV